MPAKPQAEFFDRHPALPIILLLLLPFALQVPLWLFGLSTDPVWFYSDISSGAHSLPGLPFLDPNAGYTSQALGHLAAWDWVHGIIPWWNPFTGIGVPLAGELQPGAFFFPFNLLLLLKEGILWQRLVMQVIAGLATYALLRELRLSRLAAFLGGALFAMNGVIAWTPGPVGVYCVSPFLPSLLWGIERARKPAQGALSTLIIGLSIAWSILAGFPEPAYISGLLALAWGIYRLTSAPARWTITKRALGGFVLGLLVSAPLLIAFVDYLAQSDSFNVHALGGSSLPWAAFATTLMPYVFGPLTLSLNPNGPLSDIWGGLGGYTEAALVVMALAAFTRNSADRGLKLLLLIWVVICWARNFGVQPISVIINHLPLLSRAAFYRYADASWILALIVLAAYGLDEFRNSTPSRRMAFGVVLALLGVAVAVAWPQRAFWGWSHSKALIMFAFLGIALLWAFAGLAALWLIWRISNQEKRRTLLAAMLVLDAAAMFFAAQISARRHNQVDTQAMQFLHDHQGLFRIYSLGPLSPNYGAYFQVADINHNILPVPRLWGEYVDRNLLPGYQRDHGVTFFWPPMSHGDDDGARKFQANLANYRDIGVKYVLAKPGQDILPTTYLDNADATLLPQSGEGKRAWVDRFTALQHSIASRPAKWPGERFAFKIANSLLTQALASSVDSRATSSSQPLTLLPGQAADMQLAVPADFTGAALGTVGVLLENAPAPADGELEARICNGPVCSSGLQTLANGSSGGFFKVTLDQPVTTAPGTMLHVTLTHRDGTRPLALAVSAGGNQQLQGPTGALPGQELHLTLNQSMPANGFHKVYTDSVMDIWELPAAAPYFEVTQGGPCSISLGIVQQDAKDAQQQRQDLTTVCSSAATLRRRELYMPGWTSKVNGTAAQPVQQDGLFQDATLPAGQSEIHFRFTPPHMEFGWAACLAGLLGLIWQTIQIARSRGETTSRYKKY